MTSAATRKAGEVKPLVANGPHNSVFALRPRYNPPLTDDVSMEVGHRTLGDFISVLLTPVEANHLALCLCDLPTREPWQFRDLQTTATVTMVDDVLEIRVSWHSGRCRTVRLDARQTKPIAQWLNDWVETSWSPHLLRSRKAVDPQMGREIPEAVFEPTGNPAADEQMTVMQHRIGQLESDKDKLIAALNALTHHPAGNPGPCIAGDCTQDMDAAVHHTPARVLGLPPNEGGTPGIGAYQDGKNPVDTAALVIATSLHAADTSAHTGWGCRLPGAKAAALDLIAAGWAPPVGR
ncbi:hypothetical protein GCM10029978_067300 [Actinoallomurus acanthiterrae]